MIKQFDNSAYGNKLQCEICDLFKIKIDSKSENKLKKYKLLKFENIDFKNIIDYIFDIVNAKPITFETFNKENQYNFKLDNGKTLDIRTCNSKRMKISPNRIGQAGFEVINEVYSDVLGGKRITNKMEYKTFILDNPHIIVEKTIDYILQADVIVFVDFYKLTNYECHISDAVNIIYTDSLSNNNYDRGDFYFTRDSILSWNNSTTLKYRHSNNKNNSLIEIQDQSTNSSRNFTIRWYLDSLLDFCKTTIINTETLGMSAEYALGKYVGVDVSNLANRVNNNIVEQLLPVMEKVVIDIPNIIKHTGSIKGERGGQSKCAYDFLLENGKTLSLKTNKKGNCKVCPPEVGQPSKETFINYFGEMLCLNNDSTLNDIKSAILVNIKKMLPIYTNYLLDSDYLVWIKEENNEFVYKVIQKKDIKFDNYKSHNFSFTRNSIDDNNEFYWRESTTLKYKNISIGEFQIHNNRNCIKFRFNLSNFLKLIEE